jgi:hydrogenase-4 component B
MGGLALACFVKVFGVVFLGRPRDAGLAPHATPAAMTAAMAVLAILCLFIGVAPMAWVPLVRASTAQLAQTPVAEIEVHLGALLSPAAKLTQLVLVFGVLVCGLAWLRRSVGRLSGAGLAPEVATWGCGYAAPTPRMQYTASSFAASLVTTFRSVLWPERLLAAPSGSFPRVGRLETHAPDIAEHDLFSPIFRGMARVFAMVRTVSWRGEIEGMGEESVRPRRRGPLSALLRGAVFSLRRGSIQVRLFFIVLTLVVLFAAEAAVTRGWVAARRESASFPITKGDR